ncbi:hypothetical protein Agabi119p4_5579 [Agaricus bisporus var. burnettii]|uniref:Uncharacterized protein n=1 Tax=Agaricus bisporus var. burnettii TaxID=192524 RepID=A0A8H7KGJ7_AGABI|nr:hypothetical protein Agabi119p4_5579 [Agaricus bisporus var. burnettii]
MIIQSTCASSTSINRPSDAFYRFFFPLIVGDPSQTPYYSCSIGLVPKSVILLQRNLLAVWTSTDDMASGGGGTYRHGEYFTGKSQLSFVQPFPPRSWKYHLEHATDELAQYHIRQGPKLFSVTRQIITGNCLWLASTRYRWHSCTSFLHMGI